MFDELFRFSDLIYDFENLSTEEFRQRVKRERDRMSAESATDETHEVLEQDLYYDEKGQLVGDPPFTVAAANDVIYRGENEESLAPLIESLRTHGQLEPMVVSRDHVIISGHRRWQAILKGQIDVVRYRYEDAFSTDPDFEQMLVSYNKHRVKSIDEVVREKRIELDGKEAREMLVRRRAELDLDSAGITEDQIVSGGPAKRRARITKAKYPLLNAVKRILLDNSEYLPLSIRQIHYKLLNDPPLIHASKKHSRYRNEEKAYRNLSDLLTRARIGGIIPFNQIKDLTRPLRKARVYENAETFIELELKDFLYGYQRNLQGSQPDYIHVVAEKLTIETIIRRATRRYGIDYSVSRGFSSIDSVKELIYRFRQSRKKRMVLLALSDHDPEGVQIVQSLSRVLQRDFGLREDELKIIRVALTAGQADEENLPVVYEAKSSSANYKKFVEQYGPNAWELEAVPAEVLEGWLDQAIRSVMDIDLFNQEIEREERDAQELLRVRSDLLTLYRESNLSGFGEEVSN